MWQPSQHTDAYSAMMKRLAHSAGVYGFLAVLTLASAVFFAREGHDGAGRIAPAVELVRDMIGLFCLFAGAGLGVISLWFGIQYVYFDRWPERFRQGEDL